MAMTLDQMILDLMQGSSNDPDGGSITEVAFVVRGEAWDVEVRGRVHGTTGLRGQGRPGDALADLLDARRREAEEAER